MTEDYDSLEQYIRTHHADHDSVDDQVSVADLLYDEGLTPSGTEKTQKEIADLVDVREVSLEYSIGTILDNLGDFPGDEFDAIESTFPPGPETYIISERLDDVILDRFEEVLEHDREALIDHIQEDDPIDEDEDTSSAIADGGVGRLRRQVADGLDKAPGNVEHSLRSGDAMDQVNKLNNAVEAIQEGDETTKNSDYGKITFRHVAYRYNLTQEATRLKEAEHE